jgi:hypothetical protein
MKTENQNAVKTEEQQKVEYVVNTVKLNDLTKIKFADNPKRQKSAAHSRYSKYQNAKTFGEYLKLNEGKFSMADARYDLSHGFLTVL